MGETRLRELFAWLLCERDSGEASLARCPPWPPDLFALAAAALRDTGACYRVALLGGDAERSERLKARPGQVRALGEQWRLSAAPGAEVPPVPGDVQQVWNRLLDLTPTLEDIAGKGSGCEDLLFLLAVADVACKGVGVRVRPEDSRGA